MRWCPAKRKGMKTEKEQRIEDGERGKEVREEILC
jgi:hypothetical protein